MNGSKAGRVATSSEETELAIRVGKAIAQRRAEANLTQEQVAEKLGIGTEAVSRMERGTVMPTVARLVRLAEILSCGADDLLMDGSNRASDQAKLIAQLLEDLTQNDRDLLLELLRKMSSRLKQP
ncbi:helix-turn-helix domain-containing protein [Bordetella hinzii]|uniref:helix-turn-helix domain-containing protein n=1 Tax=Bordetella hinzii TaxID=103855 RepID=UPI0009B8B9D9|nr:helix-turn-helix transcriptional regulator [Bordetella hinzii]